MKRFPIIALFFVAFSGAVNAQSLWKADRNIASTTSIMKGQHGPVYTSLLVEFNKKLGCKPEIGLLVLKNPYIGKLKRSHRWIDEKMSIKVDSSNSWSARTAYASYANGMETTFIGDKNIINQLKNGTEAVVSPMPDTMKFVLPLKGAKHTLEQAELYCRK